ncbi:MAG: hypothetical protein LBQ12_02085 [Deltaproteobacteria bacterium]|nr:hypothetical protein [Deltaproteobacteria bacterium]
MPFISRRPQYLTQDSSCAWHDDPYGPNRASPAKPPKTWRCGDTPAPSVEPSWALDSKKQAGVYEPRYYQIN